MPAKPGFLASLGMRLLMGGAFRGAEAPLFHVIFHVIFHVCFCVMVFRVMVFHVVAGPCHCCCERVDLAAPD